MNIRILAVGGKQPSWVTDGFDEYARRLTGEVRLVLTEIAVAKRPAKASDAQVLACKQREGEQLLSRIGSDDWVVLLDEQGRNLTSQGLSQRLSGWLDDKMRPVVVIGGPDGVSEAVRARANETFALSGLTLPHGLVRVFVAEALYRAWSIRNNHPYHRA